ncbi:LOW QUALITY PROTEIN: XK-related protein 9 [Leptosomus discolor]
MEDEDLDEGCSHAKPVEEEESEQEATNCPILYWFALKYACQAPFKHKSSRDASETSESLNFIQNQAVDVVTDINMLRVFKTFSIFVQIYIVTDHGRNNFCQHAATIMSFCGISFSMVAIMKSLPDKDEFHVLYKLVYRFYNLLTITSWTLGISLITLLSVRSSIILLIFLWICGFTWILKQHMTVCKSKKMEYLYRTVVGIILVFTFLIKRGKNVCISIYYASHTVVTLGILFVYMFWKPSIIKKIHCTIVSILAILRVVLGIIFLVVYYRCFHPTAYCRPQACSDKADGEAGQKERKLGDFKIS